MPRPNTLSQAEQIERVTIRTNPCIAFGLVSM